MSTRTPAGGSDSGGLRGGEGARYRANGSEGARFRAGGQRASATTGGSASRSAGGSASRSAAGSASRPAAGSASRAAGGPADRGARARLRALPLPVLLGGMLLGGLCLLLALNTASAAEELKQRTLSDSNASASDAEQQLIRDLASRQAPAALASAATALGLVPNPNPAFLRINDDGSVSVLGSPMPASVPPPPVTTTAHPSATPTATPSKAGQPSRTPTAPVVTVTVTRAVPPASATPRPSTPRPKASKPRASASPTPSPGGHR